MGDAVRGMKPCRGLGNRSPAVFGVRLCLPRLRAGRAGKLGAASHRDPEEEAPGLRKEHAPSFPQPGERQPPSSPWLHSRNRGG